MRKTKVTVCGRKIRGYPQVEYNVKFKDLAELFEKVEVCVDDTDFGIFQVFVKALDGSTTNIRAKQFELRDLTD